MSSETLPSSAWRNSTAESSERISVGIFTSMPLAVWMLRLSIRRMRAGETVTGCWACVGSRTGGGHGDRGGGLFQHLALFHIVVEGDSGQRVFFGQLAAHLLHRHLIVVVGGLVGNEHGHLCLHVGLILIVLLHGLDGGVLNGLQLFLFRLGGGVLEHYRGKVKILVAVDVELFFQQLHGVVGQVHQCAFLHLAALGGQAGPLLDDGVDRRTVYALGVVGVAVFVVQLQDAQPRLTIAGKIHHGKVCPRNGGVRVHVVEQNARDAAGEVHKIVVVLQLVFKGGIRQRAALADIVAGKQLFDVVLQIGRLFGCHPHAAAAEHGGIQRGIQNVENGLMYDDLHM